MSIRHRLQNLLFPQASNTIQRLISEGDQRRLELSNQLLDAKEAAAKALAQCEALRRERMELAAELAQLKILHNARQVQVRNVIGILSGLNSAFIEVPLVDRLTAAFAEKGKGLADEVESPDV